MLYLADDFWAFVEKNISASPVSLRLKYHGQGREEEIIQIECRQKFGKKLESTLNAVPHLFFPSVLAGEQSTSDLLAAFHAGLIREGSVAIDLTSGLGIDVMHLSRRASKMTAIEKDETKAEALVYNLKEAAIDNCDVAQGDCRDYVEDWPGEMFDYAFIDPARRASDGSRVFALSDCEPDVAAMLPDLRKFAKTLIIKASPMLDITKLASELPGIRKVIALGSTTECKELVAVVDFESSEMDYEIEAATIFRDGSVKKLAFTPSEEKEAQCEIGANPLPGSYLYEPYPAVMKAAPYNILSAKYGLTKLHPNTNIYYSAKIEEGFPGDIWEIKEVVPYESKYIKRLKREYPAISVTTRNFDMPASALQKKLGIKDGGECRLFAVTALGNKKLMIIVKGRKPQ